MRLVAQRSRRAPLALGARVRRPRVVGARLDSAFVAQPRVERVVVENHRARSTRGCATNAL